MTNARLLAISLFGLGLFNLANADEWPQWRGPQRDGVWRESGILDKFDGERLPLKWSVPISSGYSGPTVADGRVYVTDRRVEPAQTERVHCFDWKTGENIWTYEYDCEYRDVGYQAGPRTSVLIDEGLAYSLGTMGHLYCFDAATGEVVWKHDCQTEYDIVMPTWGIASSPLVYHDLLIAQIGGSNHACLVAFDKATGRERWRALDDRASYSAPIVIQQASRDVLVCWTGDHVAGLDPNSGELFWQHPFTPTRMVISIATPVLEKDRLFVSSFYDGSLMLDVDESSLAVSELWRKLGPDEQHTESLHAMIGTPYLHGDYVYGVDSYGELRCLDAKTGDRIWEDQTATPRNRWSTIHMVRHGEDIWMFNERGELIISRLSPEGFHEVSRAKLIDPTTDQLSRRDGVCWSHPAYAHRHVFARNDKQLICSDLSAK